ncbi:MAG: hypothetical protein D4R63_03405 [Methylococcaceae bacterium]|nr:MAG: hypothetical protein D4R63_03405 [Methylococcaceae bacterium]
MRQQEDRKTSLQTPGKIEERKDEAATGSPFLWILSFGGAKESISPSGARTRLTNRRDSDTFHLIFCPFLKRFSAFCAAVHILVTIIGDNRWALQHNPINQPLGLY